MDDPWGSPWADELRHEEPVVKPTILKGEDGNGRTETGVKADVGGNKGLNSWGTEDDGFGEWAVSPGGEEPARERYGFDDADDRWETRDKGEDRGLTNGTLDQHSMPWGNTATIHGEIIPKSTSSLLPEPPEVLRQPSPDPWSVEATLKYPVHNEEQAITREEGHALESDDARIAKPQSDHSPAEHESGRETKSTTNVGSTVEEQVVENDILAEDGGPTAAVVDLEKSNNKKKHEKSAAENEPVEDIVKDARGPADPVENLEESNEKEVEIDQESSRPSSSPSDHDEILAESPRTSLDEEANRPKMPRKVSSKIQELVEHFDGLATPEIEDDLPSHVKRELPRETNEGAGDAEQEDDFDDDFGDFEEGNSEAGEALKAKLEPAPDVPPADHDLAKAISESPEAQPVIQPTVQPTPDASPPRRVLKKDFGRVQFTTDTSALAKIYPSADKEPPEKVFIQDVIPHDSFSTVEERKTWYRISRYGTMQKHNAGDDENYVRVNWTQSQIRADTLKIVARWMEEDRMSGRVVLGGASKGSSLFGWNDPNPAPVSLASAFAPKPGKKKAQAQAPAPIESEPEIPREWPKGLVRSRSTSKTRSSPKSRRRTSSKSQRNSDELKLATQPVASFGWNSGSQQDSGPPVAIPLAPQVAPVASKPALRPRQSSAAKPPALSPIYSPTFQTNQNPSSDFNGLASLMQPSPAPTPMVPPATPSVFGQGDDWGEMMSSPVNTTPPVFPPSKGLRHKRSQSLITANPNSQHPAPNTNPHFPSPLSRSGHRPTSSLDGLSAPKRPIPATSITDPLSLDIFDTMATSSPTFQAVQSPPMITATSVTNGGVDPWATADFSFFDTAPAPTTKPAPPPAAIPRHMLKANPPKSVAFATPPVPSVAVARGNGRSKAELEQDRVVASIVKGLPDLSYMLRK